MTDWKIRTVCDYAGLAVAELDAPERMKQTVHETRMAVADMLARRAEIVGPRLALGEPRSRRHLMEPEMHIVQSPVTSYYYLVRVRRDWGCVVSNAATDDDVWPCSQCRPAYERMRQHTYPNMVWTVNDDEDEDWRRAQRWINDTLQRDRESDPIARLGLLRMP